MAFDLFLSAGSTDFRDLRQQLHREFHRQKLNVEIQEFFCHESSHTLVKLLDHLLPCRHVIHVLGENPGARPSVADIQALYARLLEDGLPLLSNQPALAAAIHDPDIIRGLTYTQWEAVLAIHLGIPLVAYATEAGAEAQADHILRLEKAVPAAYTITIPPQENVGLRLFSDFIAKHDDLPARSPNNLPASIGPRFIGRTIDLQSIADAFQKEDSASLAVTQAVSGLGGIGKTRLAVEFAHRHARQYTALLFARADSPGALKQNIANLADPAVLDLDAYEADLETRYRAVVAWLKTKTDWLLILDNVDDEEAAEAVNQLLAENPGGHILITSRVDVWRRNVTEMKLETLTPAESRDLLLSTSGITEPLSAAEEDALVALAGRPSGRERGESVDTAPPGGHLGGLAVAIELAGAYIDQEKLHFSEYLDEFQRKKAETLAFIDHLATGYPDSVAATWLTSIEKAGREAREVLCQLSYWSPEPIPREIFGEDREALRRLARYSLVKLEREPFSSIVVHRLVLEIAATLIPETQAEESWQNHLAGLGNWAPEDGQAPETWEKWAQFQPHAGKWVEQIRALSGEADILNGFAGFEMYRNAAFDQAEPLLRRALAIDEASFGEDHPEVAIRLNNLAQLLKATNRLEEAEPLMRRALAIDEASFGEDHPDVAIDLNNLAQLLQATNRLEEAEPLMRRALAIDEASFGEDHPDVAIDLNNLAALLQDTNRLEEAEPLMRRALAIDEASFGEDHPKVAIRLNNLAQLLKATNRLEEAEPLMRRALAIDEASFGEHHPKVAIRLNNLAQLLKATNRLEEAEPLSRRALEITTSFHQKAGHQHPNHDTFIANYRRLLTQLGLSEAETEAKIEEFLHGS